MTRKDGEVLCTVSRPTADGRRSEQFVTVLTHLRVQPAGNGRFCLSVGRKNNSKGALRAVEAMTWIAGGGET